MQRCERGRRHPEATLAKKSVLPLDGDETMVSFDSLACTHDLIGYLLARIFVQNHLCIDYDPLSTSTCEVHY